MAGLDRKLAAIWLLLGVHDYALYVLWFDSRVAAKQLLPLVLARAAAWFCVSRFLFFVTDFVARRTHAAGLMIVAVTLTGVTCSIIAFNAVTLSLTVWPLPIPAIAVILLRLDFHAALLWVAMIVALGRAIQMWQEQEQRRLRQVQLETALIKAKLSALADQLEPHFLFNTLTGAAALCVRDAAAARSMIRGLQQLLEYSLGGSNAGSVFLRDELEFVSCYVRLQRIRFGDRLDVREPAVTDAALDCLVPRLVLQPLIENAIKYGAGGSDERVVIEVMSHVSAGTLVIRIRNSAGGPAADAGAGIGIASVRARLDLVFPGAHEVRLVRDKARRSATVQLRMPALSRHSEANR